MKSNKQRKPAIWRWLVAALLLLPALAVAVAALWAHGLIPLPLLPPANPYGAEDFAYDGDYLTCTAGESLLGVDVSYYQGDIDWTQVRAAGVDFAMVRLGYRGYRTGAMAEDTHAQANLDGAAAAGLRLGAYFYSQAVTPEEAVQEAQLALEILRGRELQLPIAFDWEYVGQDARTAAMDAATMRGIVRAFCDPVRAAGYEPMVYFNRDLSKRLFRLGELTEYDFWLAMYDQDMTFPFRVQMWQYTSHGTVPGIEGRVDLNLYLP